MSRVLHQVVCLLAVASWAAHPTGAAHVVEGPKEIPVALDADVLVVGGSSGAVEAACEAAARGARVALLADRPYLGTDLCATLQLWLEPDEQPRSRLALACFGHDRVTTPLRVKAEMDKALLRADAACLTGCYVSDVLRDADGQLAGVVMANRSGRQAVRAKVIIDATCHATVARLADAAFRSRIAGPLVCRRVVIGGKLRSGADLVANRLGFTYPSDANKASPHLPVYEYTLRLTLADDTVAGWAAMEHQARDATYGDSSETASEVLRYEPSDTIVGQSRLDVWSGAAAVDLGPFRPRETGRLYVLSLRADLENQAATRLQRPLELMELGTRIGRAAADEAQALPLPLNAALPENAADGDISGEVGEDLSGIRPPDLGRIRAGRRALPLLGRYDVVVVGGGTTGAPAGIAAAKRGARTLVVEYLYELGGVGTAGLIAQYWYGRRRGYTEYVDQQVNPGQPAWSAAAKAEWLRRELLGSGADVWLGTFGCGVLTEGGQVRGVVVATPQGRGVVLASTVIDATGNADIAAWAGAPTQYGLTENGCLNVQIAGFPARPLQRSYVNTCYTLVDDTDVLDVWHLMAWKRTALRTTAAFDVGQLVDSRERRRVVGDYTLTVLDILTQRSFPDTISQHYSNFDAAAFPDSRLLLVRDAKGPCFETDMPYRCLLPRGLDGILVVGLGASAERDAMTLVRMQADLQNQGYAAGLAAAAAVQAGGHTRDIDLKALQKELVRQDVLDERVLTDRDSYPRSLADIERAVAAIGDPDQRQALAALALVMAHSEQALPLLKKAYQFAAAGQQREYATVLGVLGDPTGAATLAAASDAAQAWDQGASLTSQRKTGNTFSELDRFVIALGLSGAPQAGEVLLRKLDQLQPDSRLSHYQAMALAMQNLLRPAAAEPLARLLSQPGFAGHATTKPTIASRSGDGLPMATTANRLVTTEGDAEANGTNLNQAYRELIIAALLYRCGDRDGIAAAILRQYAQDVHGHFARYAQLMLDREKVSSRGREVVR